MRMVEPSIHPTYLDISIGGYPGPFYKASWEPPHLVYRCWEHAGEEEPETVKLQPAAEEWQAFWSDLEAVGFWTWKAQYKPKALILDGTGWAVSVRIRDRSVESDGDNAYPRGFKQFCKAVSRLVGGRAFE
jgi:hypothetical protein